ncbi:hypothetical protein IAT40_005002 [Kwoniella sp. CBS 6097]
MRIRIALLPPFAPNKIILPVPEDVKTISALKKYIVHSLAAVAEHATKGKDIVLEIDGFELLGGSGLDVIEGGDIVSVRLAPGSSKLVTSKPISYESKDKTNETSKKRRISSVPLDMQEHKRRRMSERAIATPEIKHKPKKTSVKARTKPDGQTSIVQTSQAVLDSEIISSKRARASSSSSSSSSPSSSSASSSSASDTSSSSSSSSSSDASSSSASSSASSSSSSSSSSSPSAPESAKRPDTFPVYKQLENSAHSLPHVPPGQGKTATQNRNARRRLARQYKKQAAQASDSKFLPATAIKQNNAHRTSESVVEGIAAVISAGASELPVPRSTANRNKKRGFLEDMKAKKGTKTVFASGEVSDKSVDNSENPVPTEESRQEHPIDANGSFALPYTTEDPVTLSTQLRTPSKRARVTAPSEMTDLPSNLFVTSAEFSRAPISPRQRQKNAVIDQRVSGTDLVGQKNGNIETDGGRNEAVEADDLDADEEMAMNEEEDMWARVDREYESLPVLSTEQVQSLSVGTVLACKELELNMTTFSPELMLKLVRISSLQDNGLITIEKMTQPIPEGYDAQGEEDGYVYGHGPGYDQAGGSGDESEEKTFSLSGEEIGSGKWRIA